MTCIQNFKNRKTNVSWLEKILKTAKTESFGYA